MPKTASINMRIAPVIKRWASSDGETSTVL